MASTTFNNRGVCQVCEKGYDLNYDSYCEKVVVDMCDTSSDYVLNSRHDSDPMYSYYHSQSGLGCSLCTGGYYAQ